MKKDNVLIGFYSQSIYSILYKYLDPDFYQFKIEHTLRDVIAVEITVITVESKDVPLDGKYFSTVINFKKSNKLKINFEFSLTEFPQCITNIQQFCLELNNFDFQNQPDEKRSRETFIDIVKQSSIKNNWIPDLNDLVISVCKKKNGELVIPKNVKLYPMLDLKKYKFKKIVFEDGRSNIDFGMFTKCGTITEVVLPEGLTILPNFRKISIPSHLQDQIHLALNNCFGNIEIDIRK